MFRQLLVTLLVPATVFAAPPSVTTLSPAGGQRGKPVAVTATGTFDRWPVKVWSSAPGVTAKVEKTKGQFTVTVAPDAPLGVAWLRFHDDTGASPLRPFLVGGLPEVNEVEPNDDARTAPPVTLPAVVNGVLSKSGDVDCVTVKLKKGETLVASLEAHRTLRSPMDAVLQVTAADGTVVAQNHDARGLDPEVAFTAPADGPYAVRVFAFPAQPDSGIRHFGSPACVYRLTLTTGEFVDFTTPLAVEAGREAALTLHGWNLRSGTAKLGKTDASLGLARPVPVAREPHPCFDLTAGPGDAPLTPPFIVTGRVSTPGAVSVVPLTVGARKPLALRLDSATLDLSLTPVLTVTDAAGKQLLKAEPAKLGGAIEATLTPPATGPVKIEVRDLFRTGGPRHVYRLRVTPVAPGVEVTVAADRFTATVGKPLDISIAVTRTGGFAGDLRPFADGLPEGVSVVPAPPPAKADPNTVVLRLTATRAGSGPIRVGVTKAGDAGFRRFAAAPLPEFGRPSADLWLSVKPE